MDLLAPLSTATSEEQIISAWYYRLIHGHREIRLLTSAMQAWHEHLYQHSINVAFLAEQIAGVMGYSKKEREMLVIGSLLHDIGKTNWPQQMVFKELEDKDIAIIHAHPTMGYYRVIDIWPSVPAIALRIIQEHHERSNGRGYPRKLSNEQIHPLTHVAAVVEVYMAMTEQRPYRKKSLNDSEALAEIQKECFPTEVFEALRKIIIK